MEILWTTQLLLILSECVSHILSEETPSYCQDENFQAQCGDGQVILMTSALYGRMRKGRCVSMDYGHLGCSANVLDLMDSYCSGKPECDFRLFESSLKSRNSCSPELLLYLEAMYSCIPVLSARGAQCQATHTVAPDTAETGYISSADLKMTSRGASPACAWTLEAGPGQKFQLSLMYFPHVDDNFQPVRSSNCFNLFNVYEEESMGHAAQQVTSCDVRDREGHVWTSSGNIITVHINVEEISNVGEFLIKYQVLGCSDLPPSPGASMRRTERGEGLEVTCNTSGQVWNLVCQDSTWIGERGTCQPAGRRNEKLPKDKQNDAFPFGILIIVAAGVALGVFLGGILLSLAAIHMKRRQRRRFYRQEMEYHKTWTLPRDAYSVVTCPECASAEHDVHLQAATNSSTFPRSACDVPDAYKDYVTYKNKTKQTDDVIISSPVNYRQPDGSSAWTKRGACEASGCL